MIEIIGLQHQDYTIHPWFIIFLQYQFSQEVLSVLS